jgi:hypothetical protein
MKKGYTYIIITVLIAVFGFSSVTYTSCKRKAEGDATFGCDTIECKNAGVCSYGKCTCPSGYDGLDCSIALAEKFIDTSWRVRETVVKSSDIIWIGTTSEYNILTRSAYTATSFFIDSIWGDRYKGNILCEIKSPTTFEIQPFQPINNNNPNTFRIISGFGSIDTVGVDTILGTYYRYLADSAGARTDTVDFRIINNNNN